MLPRPIRHRRGRRTDFVEIAGILAASDAPVPVPDRATLRRFRSIVSDLGADFYVALFEERLVGFVHVTYARQLADAPRARVEALIVAPAARRNGVGSALAGLARSRAERRGCRDLSYAAGALPPEAAPFLARQGWSAAGEVFQLSLGDVGAAEGG
jgi:GNAT superfamily N-acetyltransferase